MAPANWARCRRDWRLQKELGIVTGNRHSRCLHIGGKLTKKKTALLSVGMISLGLLVGQVVAATAAPDGGR
ncbi:hypothetical protein ARTHRO9V_280216 [Arthrobacter sp. 9V]|nr:hypothetical protein ARTHRO9V_280216 [Arthrobacter sp. 9V]